jgi:tRNA (guanine37-N1)-methyltransferase
MKFSIITLFPDFFTPVLSKSILGRAQSKKLVGYETVDLRAFGQGKHLVVDDKSYGGGVGMVLKPDILKKALTSTKITKKAKTRVVLMSASGNTFNQKKAREFSKLEHLIIICGHYEGVDQRFIDKYVDDEVSIGDFVLTGGEIPAMAVIDAVTRVLPGVLEKEEATLDESFENGLLEYPHYTRPENFEGENVPEVLTSGNHQEIEKWRREKALEKTIKTRPDLIKAKE